jgi:hypothetical protein
MFHPTAAGMVEPYAGRHFGKDPSMVKGLRSDQKERMNSPIFDLQKEDHAYNRFQVFA